VSTVADPRTTRRPLWFFVNLAHVLVAPDESGGAVGVVELTGSRGEMPPLHVHHREDEVFVVLEGELTVFLPGASRAVRAGEAAFAPRGVAHAYRVESERARWLAVSTPAGFASFVAAASEPAEADDLPPADRPLDMDRLVAAAEAHGIEILASPGTLP
jgi:mannose-6-phosphate isomerase-like protein (cupin superfamily)